MAAEPGGYDGPGPHESGAGPATADATVPTSPPGILGADDLAAQLGEPYASLEATERAAHPDLIARIRQPGDIAGDSRPLAGGAHVITVAAGDIPGALALISGSMTAHGLDIQAGDLFTVRRSAGQPVPRRSRRFGPSAAAPPRRPGPSRSPAPSALLLDRFVVTGAPSPDPWEEIRPDLEEAFTLLAGGETEAARAVIIDGISRRLPRGGSSARAMYPVAIEVDAVSEPETTVVSIAGADETGFLFEFANALAMLEISVRRAEVRTEEGESRDTFWVTTRGGSKLVDASRLDELRVVAVLIRQFTQLLPLAPDPGQALRQFGALVRRLFSLGERREALSVLADESVLEMLAAALGVSRYLWEDFLRLQHEHLFPVLTDLPALDRSRSAAELRGELHAESAAGVPVDVASLNLFKDRALFQIDLRHIIGRTGFADFSLELSDLAEVVVDEAAALTARSLRERHGRPRLASGEPCGWAVAALGKFGGREIGFASDLELLTVYEGPGGSDGSDPIPNATWFEEFVRGLRAAIRAPREGIFEVDLRLRPYGDGGSLASSLDQCRSYYSAAGDAWQFERMALVRLRTVAGDAAVGRRLESIRDAFVYSGAPLDVGEMLRVRGRQASELVDPGRRNAKYSRGGLVDVEYYVQSLQILAGTDDPSVRTTNTLAAIAALAAAGRLSAEESTELSESYSFLRQLIGALRVVRGNARDLTIPPTGSREFAYLARRMASGTPGALEAAIGRRMDFAASLWERLPAGEPPLA